MLRRRFLVASALVVATLAVAAYFHPVVAWAFVPVGPIVLLGVYDSIQRHHALRRNYPVIGHGRYLLESFRPEIQQYFVETNTDGRPFNRVFRSIVYQRAKGALQTSPFGTQQNVQRVGYEWMEHSMMPRHHAAEPRVRIGGPDCAQPYDASHLNVSAMSFGSLSRNAISALSRGAKLAGCWHNTGEGGLSPHHLDGGADLVWQIGTGYFGCRTRDGEFDAGMFAERSQLPNVKMVEIKLSQGAKPAHGGILPGSKVTKEIAAIRGVEVGKDVLSPPWHSTFDTPTGLMEFVARLREGSGGKPIGFKLCIGRHHEFMSICKAMLETGIAPDFITIDGGEGGTGAAPLEFSDSVGSPLREGLLFARNALTGAGLDERVRLVAAGKIITGFHLIRALALGADVCNSARGMMFALGCIQARRCNDNSCPVGVATTNARLAFALDVDDKAQRVARYHRETIKAFLDLLGAAGLAGPDELRPEHVNRRVAFNEYNHYGELYAYLSPGALLDGSAPREYLAEWQRADATVF